MLNISRPYFVRSTQRNGSHAELFAYTVRLGTVTSAFVHPNLARERVVSLPRGARRSGKATTGAESFG